MTNSKLSEAAITTKRKPPTFSTFGIKIMNEVGAKPYNSRLLTKHLSIVGIKTNVTQTSNPTKKNHRVTFISRISTQILLKVQKIMSFLASRVLFRSGSVLLSRQASSKGAAGAGAVTGKTKEKWDLLAGVLVERLPVVTKTMEPIEAKFKVKLRK